MNCPRCHGNVTVRATQVSKPSCKRTMKEFAIIATAVRRFGNMTIRISNERTGRLLDKRCGCPNVGLAN